MVPSFPWDLWYSTICLNGKSQMTSELRTKKGSSLDARTSRDSARGPAVPAWRGNLQVSTDSNTVKSIILTERFLLVRKCDGDAQPLGLYGHLLLEGLGVVGHGKDNLSENHFFDIFN